MSTERWAAFTAGCILTGICLTMAVRVWLRDRRHRLGSARGRRITGPVDPDVEEAMSGLDVYRIRGVRWTRTRDGIPRARQRQWWRRTWQCEWDGCRRAPRAWTRVGVIVKATRARLREGLPSTPDRPTDALGLPHVRVPRGPVTYEVDG